MSLTAQIVLCVAALLFGGFWLAICKAASRADNQMMAFRARRKKHDIEEYQKFALESARYPNVGNNLVYVTLGLAGEAGEFANRVKKIQRDDGGVMTDAVRAQLIDELGDCLWYVAQAAYELGTSLPFVIAVNTTKLMERAQDRSAKQSKSCT